MIFSLIQLAVLVIILISFWKIFEKAGRPGWEGLVPFYNLWILATVICRKPPIWFVIGLIPIVNILLLIELAKCFGKGVGYAVGLLLLGFVFFPMLAFGPDKYTPPAPAPQ
jgi:hypothetical protein